MLVERKSHVSRRLAAASLPIITALLGAGCAGGNLETGGLQLGQASTSQSEPGATASSPWQASTTRPQDAPMVVKPAVAAVIKDARALRASGDKAKALSTLDKAENSDKEPALIKERGLLALELGQIEKAESLLRKAQDPKAPDWRVHSALGAALSAGGKQNEAQLQFAKALEIAPDQPSVLNNLALSYALDGKHEAAEDLLRRVGKADSGGSQVQQNLALILGLKGNIEESTKVSATVLPADAVQANVSYLKKIKDGPVAVSRAEPVEQQLIRAASVASSDADKPIMQLGGASN